MQAHSNAAAGNGAPVGGVTSLAVSGGGGAGGGGPSNEGSQGNSKMQSLGDGEGADQVGCARVIGLRRLMVVHVADHVLPLAA